MELIVAAGLGQHSVVKMLLEKGADVNDENKEGYTALHKTIAEYTRDEVLKNEKGLVGQTLQPAYDAFKKNDFVIPRMTVGFQKKDDIGNMTKEILENRILKLTGKNVEVISLGLISGEVTPVKALKKKGLDIKELQRLARFLILLANGVIDDQTNFESFEYENARLDIVKLLIGYSKCKSVRGHTPLHTAVSKGSLEIVKLLGNTS